MDENSEASHMLVAGLWSRLETLLSFGLQLITHIGLSLGLPLNT
jgi:hypothetical protein